MPINPRLQRVLPWLLSGAVLLAGSTTTVIALNQAREREESTLNRLLQAEARRITMNITHRLTNYETVMRGVQGFFRGSDYVDYGEFVEYAANLRATDSLAGVQAIAFVALVPRDELAAHLEEVGRQVPVPYRIHPEGFGDTVAPITYIAPLKADNRQAVGFNIYSNPAAATAANLARDSGDAVITAPFSLIQDADSERHRSFVLYLPVYRPDAATDTVAQRRLALMGWVDVPFRMSNFMASIREEINPHIDFEIRDAGLTGEENLLFHSDTTPHRVRRQQGELQTELEIQVGARTWKLLFSNTPAFRAQAALPPRSHLIGTTGGALSFALSLFVFLITRNWDNSERRAARMSHLYHALSEVNQAIVRGESEEELFPLVCRMAVDFGGMKMAWVGTVDEHGEHIAVTSCYGQGSGAIQTGVAIPIGQDTALGGRPMALAARHGEPVIVNDYRNDPRTRDWRHRARQFGWRASAAFPIHRGQRIYAVLNVFHHRRGAFDEDANKLLVELTTDLGFALDNFDRERERVRFEQELADSEDRLSTILENVGACIYMKDLEGRYLFVNQQVLDLWGIESEEDVIGATDEKFLDAVTARQVRENDRKVLERGEIFEREEVDTVKTTGITLTFWSVKIPLRRTDGTIYALCGISTDISESKAREEKIRYLSNYDALTGLPNRELLRERTLHTVAAARAGGKGVALLCIDLDRFKIINESLGHNVGDLVLKRIAERLNAELHRDATLSRIGGDEFILLLPDADREQATATAQRLQQVISRPLPAANQNLNFTASIGIALFPHHGRDFDQLNQSADAALTEAKQQGRNRVLVFSADLRHRVDAALQLENELRRAVETEQLVLHYQPQLDFDTGRIVGVEALVRWQHPQRGMIPPGRFIPVAEESGLIIDIGNWVLNRALVQLNAWRKAGLPQLSVAVNLSVVQLYRDGFFDTVVAALERHRIPGNLLELEITERIAMEHSSYTIATLAGLQRLGVALSIDDFGTGFSSLNYLKRYPIHKLKIDKSFVDGLGRNPEDRAIVIAIIGLARGLGFLTIAEGVESRDQWEFLRSHGCDAYQGFYFSRAVPADDIARLLTTGSNQFRDP